MTDPTCIFCKIATGAIPVERFYEDDLVLAFPDQTPKAPTHVLLIPKQHIPSHAHTGVADEGVLGRLMTAAATVARDRGLSEGYRLVTNSGEQGGQTVSHLHLHLLGGRPMGWPPG